MMLYAASSRMLDALGDDILSGAARSLKLLKDIEATISSLCYDQRYYAALTSIAKDAATNIRTAPRVKALDPDASIQEKLLLGQEAAYKLYTKLVEKRESAVSDPQLTDEDGVADEYTRTIEVVAEMHNSIDELRWILGEYDAELTPRKAGTVLTSPEEIEQFLRAL